MVRWTKTLTRWGWSLSARDEQIPCESDTCLRHPTSDRVGRPPSPLARVSWLPGQETRFSPAPRSTTPLFFRVQIMTENVAGHEPRHVPVLAAEVLDGLAPEPG